MARMSPNTGITAGKDSFLLSYVDQESFHITILDGLACSCPLKCLLYNLLLYEVVRAVLFRVLKMVQLPQKPIRYQLTFIQSPDVSLTGTHIIALEFNH